MTWQLKLRRVAASSNDFSAHRVDLGPLFRKRSLANRLKSDALRPIRRVHSFHAFDTHPWGQGCGALPHLPTFFHDA